jgi:hypothetical protein
MNELDDGQKAFSSFRVLNEDADRSERAQLFRHMAQLYAFVSNRCDDDQIAQYDEVLSKLADLVEVEARAHVARVLAPLERAPGTVIAKLANDTIEVAEPLLEFSNVLSDDDLIDIVAHQSEAHRVAIASRPNVPQRVGDAIVVHGGQPSVGRLVRNSGAELGQAALQRLMERATTDAEIAADLRGRADVDWETLQNEIASAGNKVLSAIASEEARIDPAIMGKVNAVVYNRMRNRAGFSGDEWKVAYNQVKALADRKQLDERALVRFVRFGYGHHAAAALAQMMGVAPEVFVKWLAMQDYVAMTVALRALGVQPEMFASIVATLPWRDLPTDEDKTNVRRRFEALTVEEAQDIFDLWRSHAFRKKSVAA